MVHHQWEPYSFHSSQASYRGANPVWEWKKQSCLNLLTTNPVLHRGSQPFRIYSSWKISVFCPLSVQENRIAFVDLYRRFLWLFCVKLLRLGRSPFFKKLGDSEVWNSTFSYCLSHECAFCLGKMSKSNADLNILKSDFTKP